MTKKIMHSGFLILAAGFLFFSAHAQPEQTPPMAKTINFDKGWKFFRGGVQGGEDPKFDDARWRTVDLPHDWSIEDLPGSASPFDSNAISQTSGGFTTGGTGWYRKKFRTPAGSGGMNILFEGVYMNADVWLNGHFLGNHPYGYTSFWYDLSAYLLTDNMNVLAVQVRNEGQNSRWYTGSGIYRHVWLKQLGTVYIPEWGIAILTSGIADTVERVTVTTPLIKEGTQEPFLLHTIITGPNGVILKTGDKELNKTGTVVQDFFIDHPQFWSVDTPALYKAVSEIYHASKLISRTVTRFGMRDIRADAEHGFQLNGVPLKLKGACIHQDHGPLGVRSYDRAEERRVELLKAAGFNAVRCAHNPPAPAFLDFCDSLGMLVVDEAFDMWQDGKNPYDYHLYFENWWQKDVASMVNRDRNHPSVIMWSIGNEIPNKDSPAVIRMGRDIAAYTRLLDPTRLITAAVNEEKDPFFDMLDIAGYNYGLKNYEADHVRSPGRIMMGTESYPLEAFDYWRQVEEHPYIIGDFVWTGFDYMGEASIGWRGYWPEKKFYPWNLAWCGDLDLCGWKRPQSYYRDALWKKDQLSIFVRPPTPSFPLNPHRQPWSKWHWEDLVADWNWTGNDHMPLEVVIYSSCEEVELFLNDRSLGRKLTDRSTRNRATWNIPFEKGRIKAVGLDHHIAITSAELVTAGSVAETTLTADRKELSANGQDLSYITIVLTDAKGIPVTKSDQEMVVTVTGPGTILGIANGNPTSVRSFQRSRGETWRGKSLVIIKSTDEAGSIDVKVQVKGLPPATLRIRTTFSSPIPKNN